MSLLVTLLFLLAAATGTGVALSRTPRRQVMAMAVNGLVLALLFMAELRRAPVALWRRHQRGGPRPTPCQQHGERGKF
jgi:energy-converting hydrogenase B subunit D